jgi:hypothetical protein
MGGPGAPDDINQAHLTQAWLAVSNDPDAIVTEQYFYHMRPCPPNPQVYDTALQDALLDACERLSGVKKEPFMQCSKSVALRHDSSTYWLHRL